MAELPERLSAQVITTVSDYSRLDTTPSRAALGVITATKGPVNELHLVQTTAALTSLFGEPSADHLGLVGAYKIIASGVGMYLVRVGDPEALQAATATIPGTAPNVVNTVGQIMISQPADPGSIIVDNTTTGTIADDCIGNYMVSCSKFSGSRSWTGTFNGTLITVTDAMTDATKSSITVGDTGISFVINNLDENTELQFSFDVSQTTSGTVASNIVLTMSEVGTYGNDYHVTVAAVENESHQIIGYTIKLFKGKLSYETLTVSLDSSASNYIFDIESEHFTISKASSTSPDPTALTPSATDAGYPFSGGNDGFIKNSSGVITDQDALVDAYIGEINETTGEATGSKLFLQPKVVAQIYPSLGMYDKNYLNAMKAVSESKKYITCIFDTPPDITLNTVCKWVNNTSDSPYENDPILSGWMCEVYWPWIEDSFNGYPLTMPPSVYVTINCMNWWDQIGPQLPVAGNPRGIINNVSASTEIPSVVDRDKLVTNRINPIFNTGTAGTQIFGNETLNEDYTDLRSAHISRQLAQIITQVNTATARFEFELNDSITWQRWIDSTTTILQSYANKGGLKWFGVRMGLDTTTAKEIAQRQIRGLIGLQFVQDAEVFWLNYAVYASSAEEIDF